MTTPVDSAAPATNEVSMARNAAALDRLGRRPSAQDPAAIRQAASQLVSQLFFAPLLAEMRRLPFGRQIGHGGRGEEIFGEQLDLRIADAVASAAAGSGLTRRIERELGLEQALAQAGADAASTPETEPRAKSKDAAAQARVPAPPATWPVLLQARQIRRTP